jgi:hypothetical protein
MVGASVGAAAAYHSSGAAGRLIDSSWLLRPATRTTFLLHEVVNNKAEQCFTLNAVMANELERGLATIA